MADYESSLVLVHVIFRHGERTPDVPHMYPKDVHKSVDLHPYGSGQLTQDGKRTMYNLGETLRKKYNDFLGDTYIPIEVDAQCTDMDRTKMSLQLVLASLYPPKGDQVLTDALKWQPIPFKFVPQKNDKMFAVPETSTDFRRVYSENYKLEESKGRFKDYEELIASFKNHTGYSEVRTREVWITLGTLSTERECGLDVPEWAFGMLPQLMEFGQLEYKMQTATNELKNLIAGEIFSKILTDSKQKINGTSKSKIHIYSGHDFNVASVLTIMGLMYSHFPRYAACILLELHKIDDTYGFKVLYRGNKTSEFQIMKFANDQTICFMEDFEKLVLSFTVSSGHL